MRRGDALNLKVLAEGYDCYEDHMSTTNVTRRADAALASGNELVLKIFEEKKTLGFFEWEVKLPLSVSGKTDFARIV